MIVYDYRGNPLYLGVRIKVSDGVCTVKDISSNIFKQADEAYVKDFVAEMANYDELLRLAEMNHVLITDGLRQRVSRIEELGKQAVAYLSEKDPTSNFKKKQNIVL